MWNGGSRAKGSMGYRAGMDVRGQGRYSSIGMSGSASDENRGSLAMVKNLTVPLPSAFVIIGESLSRAGANFKGSEDVTLSEAPALWSRVGLGPYS